MRLFLKNDPPLSPSALISIQAGILKLTSYGMLQDLYVSGNVKQVIFVGTRPDDSGLNGFRNQGRSSSNSSNNSNASVRAVGLIGGFAGVLMITMLATLFVVRKRNKEKSSKHLGKFPIDPPKESCADLMPGVTKSGSSTIDGSQESVGLPPSPHWLSQDQNQTQLGDVFEYPKPPLSEFTITCDTSHIGKPDQLSPLDQSLDMPETYDDDESTADGTPPTVDMPNKALDYC